ncbi:hypothetical protein ABFX02_06G161600 [Erythranthe guttata]
MFGTSTIIIKKLAAPTETPKTTFQAHHQYLSKFIIFLSPVLVNEFSVLKFHHLKSVFSAIRLNSLYEKVLTNRKKIHHVYCLHDDLASDEQGKIHVRAINLDHQQLYKAGQSKWAKGSAILFSS